jgi:lysophospholipase L1-like esterase
MPLLILLTLTMALGLGTAALASSRAQLSPREPTSTEASRASVSLSTPIRYAALGASDTVGVGSRAPSRENWTARLRAALPADTVYDRFARSGITLGDAADVEVPRVIAFRPTLVTMWLSVNDALRPVPLATYQKSLHATLERLTRETNAQVVLLNVPDLATLAGSHATGEMRAKLREQVRAWNEAINATTRPFGTRVLVVDLLPASRELTEHSEWLSSDGFHPSPEGYQKLADLTLQAMQRAGWLPATSPRARP